MSAPTAVATFLFTDIEGSTRRWEAQPAQMAEALAQHDGHLNEAVTATGGQVFKHTGDGVCAVFPEPTSAVTAAVAAQRRLSQHDWRIDGGIRVRMGVHHGEAIAVGEDFFGPPLNRAARIMAAAHGGQVLVSGAVAGQVLERGGTDIDLIDLGEHELRDLTGREHLFQVAAQGLETTFPGLRVLSTYRHNLPHQLTSLVGRDELSAEVSRLLRDQRLVTLTGIGGCGKTRLALRVAAESLPHHRHGVWLVELAPLTDPQYVARMIAGRVGHGERLAGIDDSDQDAILEQLVKAIGDDEILVVLDNCEHVIDAAVHSAQVLLERCRGVRVLATSREVLGMPGEHVVVVTTLTAPASDADAASVLASASGELFADRARAANPSFAVTDENAPRIASICDRLDGIPLAIELAAARVRSLSVALIDERLEDALKLLTGGERGRAERHQTLLATMEWSHGLLSPGEQAVLRRLAVFVGGFTLDAAEAVTGFDAVESGDIVDLVSRLVDRSLVAVSSGAERRFRLLEVVAQFAGRKLEEAGEAAVVRRRHFDWALALAERVAPIEFVPGTATLTPERYNLRAAFIAAEDDGYPGDDRLRFAYSLWRYMLESGQIPEGLAKLEAALESDHTTGTPLEVRSLDAAAFLASLRGRFDLAARRASQAVERSRHLDDPTALAWALNRQGLILADQGDVDDPTHPFQESLRIFASHGDDVGQAWTLVEIARGRVLQGHIEDAAAAFRQAASFDISDDRSVGAYARVGVECCRVLDDGTDPAALAQAVDELEAMQMSYTSNLGLLLASCASVGAGHHEEARRYAVRALALAHASGAAMMAVHAIEWAAQVLGHTGCHREACTLTGFVVAQREAHRHEVPGLVATLEAPFLERIGEELGAETEVALEAGRGLSLGDAVTLARRLLG